MRPRTTPFALVLMCGLLLMRQTLSLAQTPAAPPADQPAPRQDRNSQIAHEQLLAKARSGTIDVYFVGDSITRRWGALDYPDLLAHWRSSFFGWNAANFGWGGDTTQNILWRLTNGELDNVHPKVVVVMAGTNNVTASGPAASDTGRADDISLGIRAIVDLVRFKAPRATVILTAVFPRSDNPSLMPTIDRINRALPAFADGKQVRFLDLTDRLTDANGRLRDGMMNRDGLHPALPAYQVWADALSRILLELLGPRGTVDTAPPPTGDPSAAAVPPKN